MEQAAKNLEQREGGSKVKVEVLGGKLKDGTTSNSAHRRFIICKGLGDYIGVAITRVDSEDPDLLEFWDEVNKLGAEAKKFR